MMQNALSEATFRKGIKNFLNARSFNFYNPAHLYEGLQAAVDEDGPIETPEIAAVMATWELQSGFPLISVSRDGDEVSFRQERFFYGDDDSENLWWVPINYVVGSNPDFESTTPDFWLGGRSLSISSDSAPKPWTGDDWIIANIQQSGYYRVNYDRDLWESISRQLNGPGDDFAAIHLLNRAQLIDDSFHLARAGRIDFGVAMGVLNYLNRETDHLPWAIANRASALLNRWLIGTGVYFDYQAFVRRNVAALYDKLGVNIVPNELRVDRYARAIAIDLACQARLTRCLAESEEELENFMTSGTPIAPDLVATIYCNGVRGANESTRAFMQAELMQSGRQFERNSIIAGLGCIEDPTVLRSHLLTAILPGLAFSTAERTNILNSPLNHGDASLQVMIDFLRFNYGGINLISPTLVGTICSNIAIRISSERMFETFSGLLTHLEINGAISSIVVTNAMEAAREIIEWQNQNLFDFVQFFARHPPEGKFM